MTYLRKEGMRAITPEFDKAYKEWKARKLNNPNSHPLEGLIDKDTFQAALLCLGLDNQRLADVLGVSNDHAGRIRNHPEKLTLKQYETLLDFALDRQMEADCNYSGVIDLARQLGEEPDEVNLERAKRNTEKVDRFFELLPNSIDQEFYQAAFWEMKARGLLDAYASITPKNRRLIENLLQLMLSKDCMSKNTFYLNKTLQGFDNKQIAPMVLARLLAYDLQKSDYAASKRLEPLYVMSEIEPPSEHEFGSPQGAQAMGTMDEIQQWLFDEYTSPREEDVNQ